MTLRAPRTLAGRIALAATAAAVVMLGVVAVVLVAAVAARERAATDRELRAAAAQVRVPARRLVAAGLRGRAVVREPPAVARVPGAIRVRVFADGALVFDGGVGAAPGLAAAAGVRTARAGDRDWRVLQAGLSRRGTLVVAEPLGAEQARVRDLRTVIILAVLAGVVALAVAARALTVGALRPLTELRAGAARVSSARDLTARLPERGPEEAVDLARSLNAMLGRLQASTAQTERALDAARRFTADAGHELRTPLTSLRANLAALADPGLDPQERERVLAALAADQERLIAGLDGLQTLARGDAGAGAASAPLDLGDVADAALADAARRHPAVRFAFAADEGEELERSEGALVVVGDPGGLRSIADNLLENAARHGGRTVELAVESRGAVVRLRVDDDGPGVPEGERERVFGRFARGARTTAPGSGLGLAIVAQQAHRHGGRAWVGAAPGLGGARVVVEIVRGGDGQSARPPGTATPDS